MINRMTSSSRNESRKKKFESMKQAPKKEEKVKWNKKSILFLTAFGLALLFFAGISTYNFQISNFYDSKDKKVNYRTTNATIYSYETKSRMTQSEYGSSNQIVAYLVRYRYKVNGVLYNHEETLNLNTKPDFLIYIVNNLNTNSFLVQYDITSPKNAYLIQKRVEI